jgi:hypothetical protein
MMAQSIQHDLARLNILPTSPERDGYQAEHFSNAQRQRDGVSQSAKDEAVLAKGKGHEHGASTGSSQQSISDVVGTERQQTTIPSEVHHSFEKSLALGVPPRLPDRCKRLLHSLQTLLADSPFYQASLARFGPIVTEINGINYSHCSDCGGYFPFRDEEIYVLSRQTHNCTGSQRTKYQAELSTVSCEDIVAGFEQFYKVHLSAIEKAISDGDFRLQEGIVEIFGSLPTLQAGIIHAHFLHEPLLYQGHFNSLSFISEDPEAYRASIRKVLQERFYPRRDAAMPLIINGHEYYTWVALSCDFPDWHKDPPLTSRSSEKRTFWTKGHQELRGVSSTKGKWMCSHDEDLRDLRRVVFSICTTAGNKRPKESPFYSDPDRYMLVNRYL